MCPSFGNNIIWERPKIGIEYNWENDIHVYYPDFYLPKFDLYIEVKGYKRERDQYKWDSINNLLIIGKDEIKLIQNNNFDIGLVSALSHKQLKP